MDELVKQAMARWPNVPAVFGWLRLDRRGQWHLVDRQRPGFDETLHGQGSPITSPQIIDFIARNYDADAQGRWYWQNGPQRVYVDLDIAPLILRVMTGGNAGQRLVAQGGEPCSDVRAAAMDAAGALWLLCERGPGIVHDLDLGQLDIEVDESNEATVTLVLDGRRVPIAQLEEPNARPAWARFESRPRADA